ncbi:MAG TPA: SRPBCC family protein [Flavobacterium sp.]|jgi:uncharacterized protein YndB with AHSA1/START domain
MSDSTYYVETQMMIRKPVTVVFEAFVDPEMTRNFWFTKSNGRLIEGKSVQWEWEMYNVALHVEVKKVVIDKQIIIEWGTPSTVVEFLFTPIDDQRTYVQIKNYGFIETGDALVAAIKDSTGGFTTVLDGLKAFLEYGINLNLIADKFPKEFISHGNAET